MADSINKNGEQEQYDPYGLSEIDKIQQEIERDLSQIWQPDTALVHTGPAKEYDNTATSSPEPPEASVYEPPADGQKTEETSYKPEYFSIEPISSDALELSPPDMFSFNILSDTHAAETPPDDTEESVPAQLLIPDEPHESFYQETIKETEPPDTDTFKRSRSYWRKRAAVICLVCTLGTSALGAGIGAAITLARHYWFGGIQSENTGEDVNAPAGIESASYELSGAEQASKDGTLADLVKIVEPSVVNVSAVFEGDATNPFAGAAEQMSVASGIVISEDGQKVYILTNYHVVAGASSVMVTIANNEPLPAKLTGLDNEADIAVLSMDKSDMAQAGVTSITIAVFGDSDTLEVGDTVLAIGNAMGEGNSATSGIISAKEKTIQSSQNREVTLLQTDAAINPGNSGGPLINTRGEVIGINTVREDLSAMSYFYEAEGVGYSISANTVKPIIEEIMRAEPRPFLGVGGEDVSLEMAAQFDIPALGVMVTTVYDDSAAGRAGIVRTDIITSFNGSTIFSMVQLQDEVKKCKVGDTVEVKILREGRTPMTLNIKMGAYDLDNF